MLRPFVSVLIDTYNQERFIEQAIASVLEQDFPAAEREILVVDDGSSDRTPEIVQKFAPQVRLLRKPNGGQASAFNAGIPECRGEIVALLDGDDWFAPGKLAAVLNALERNPNAAAVGHGYYEFHEETKAVRTFAPPQWKFIDLATSESAREAFAAWGFLLVGALTARRKTLERAIPLPEALVFCADTPLSAVSMAGGAMILDEPLFYYRRHEHNLFSVCSQDKIRMRRRRRIQKLALERSLALLLDVGVSFGSVRALVCPASTTDVRLKLSAFGGSRLNTLRTEMRSFDFDVKNPGIGQRVVKYALLTAAALLLPPYQFYRIREWYTRRRLGSYRN